MGYIKHQAVIAVVPGYGKNTLDFDELRTALGASGASLLAGPVEGLVNGYATYFLGPDGSKEGWSDSGLGDQARAEFVAYIRDHAEYADIVEVTFGGDFGIECGPEVIDYSRRDEEG